MKPITVEVLIRLIRNLPYFNTWEKDTWVAIHASYNEGDTTVTFTKNHHKGCWEITSII